LDKKNKIKGKEIIRKTGEENRENNKNKNKRR